MASTTITSTAPSSTTCNTPAQYELPVHDASCGIPNASDDYRGYFEKCAAPAAVREYYHECALWAPALDQSVQDLIDCLYQAGVEWGDVWCTGNVNGTATGSGYPTATATRTSAQGSATATEAENAGEAEETGSDESDGENGAIMARAGGSRVVALGLLGLVVSGILGSF